ncbi:MAG TPA: sigma-E factor negative regulatory protein [Steroidobacteraceae bacterium]|jgi:negative regulator of sigma E activity|nr:sigma-E factor negative regulatory protein [Steroidobacteraceae bacterium]
MTEHLRDQLSAFLDGELPRPEVELLLRRLAGNDELRISLSRYVVIGECLRNAPGRSVTRGFAGRVSAAVAAEGGAGRRDSLGSLTRWLRPLGGLAIAATVATVAILGLQRSQTVPLDGPQVAAIAPGGSSAAAIDGPAIVEPPSYTVPAPATGGPVIPAGRLTSYVVAHSEYSSPLGRRNVLSGIIAEDPTPMDEPKPAETDNKKSQP